MVDYRAAAPKILCKGELFILVLGDEEMGRWDDMRQAKAARWAARSALDLKVSSETMFDLIDYAVTSSDLWMTFDTDVDEDCIA